MPRLVKKSAHGPFAVGDKFICMCGLSKNQPFCDKSHLQTLNEDDTKLYYYENGKQEIVEEDEECDCEECQSGDKSDKECCGGGCCCCDDGDESADAPVKPAKK